MNVAIKFTILSLYFILIGCSSHIKVKCPPDNRTVLVLNDISKAYPVYAKEYDISVKKLQKAIDDSLESSTISAGFRDKVIKFREDLKQGAINMENQLKAALLNRQTDPCDKEAGKRFDELLMMISTKKSELEGMSVKSLSQQAKNSEKVVQQNMQDSPGGVQQNMENSPGGTQLVIKHAEKVTFNAAPASRTIPADLATVLVEHLKKGKPRTIEIRSVFGDQESLGLATQIAELFEKAEWQVSNIQRVNSKPFSDIIFERAQGTLSHREFEYVMFALLKQFGHKLQLYTHRGLPSGQYRLTVGSR